MPLINVVSQQLSDTAYFWLLTFIDPNSNISLRAVNNLQDVQSRGEVYTAFPFGLVLPTDDGAKIQNVTISFPNVGRELMRMVREYAPEYPPRIKIELVLSDSPDVVEKTIDFLTVANATYDNLTISFTLAPNGIFARKTCLATYNQAEFPAMFWAIV